MRRTSAAVRWSATARCAAADAAAACSLLLLLLLLFALFAAAAAASETMIYHNMADYICFLHCLLLHISSNAIYPKLYHNSLYSKTYRSYKLIQLD